MNKVTTDIIKNSKKQQGKQDKTSKIEGQEPLSILALYYTHRHMRGVRCAKNCI